MKESEIDDAVRECVHAWVNIPDPLRSNGAFAAMKFDVAALVRRVRDAEQERCAVIASEHDECRRCEGKGYYDQGGSARQAGQCIAAAIRAPRTEEKR